MSRIPLDDALALVLDLDDPDRRDIEEVRGAGVDLAEAQSILRGRLGTFPSDLVQSDLDERIWICAIVHFVPELISWHAAHRVAESVTATTLADVGRQFRLHRITHGRFGLETWQWLTLHCSGSLFHLGRLQFALRADGRGSSDWVLDVHIPPTGALESGAVNDAYRAAAYFFHRHFPERPAARFVCFSWLLDPYLARHLPGSNIARFREGFTLVGEGHPSQGDVLYFVFRIRGTGPADERSNRGGVDVAALPRDTSLQRVVLDRIDAGGVWTAWHGHRALPARRHRPGE